MNEQINIHASAVAVEGRAVLIKGQSGQGKSALALHLLAHGAGLISDDICILSRNGGHITVAAPLNAQSGIEARYVGVLNVAYGTAAPVGLVIDMDHVETQRLPERHVTDILGICVPTLYAVDAPYFPAAVLCYLKYERLA